MRNNNNDKNDDNVRMVRWTAPMYPEKTCKERGGRD